MNSIAILDYGSQYTHLIATRLRKLGVYSEIVDHETPAKELANYAGIILSGGPESVYEEGSPSVDPEVFELGKPVLGICYGHQLMTHLLGGRVEHGTGVGAEFGKATIQVLKPEGIFEGELPGHQVWMSHGDKVTQLPEGFEILASSTDDPYSAVGDTKRHFYGLQFHPEVKHSECGPQLLKNFIRLTGASMDWDLGEFIDQSVEAIRQQVGDRKVFMLISGGVDSTVAFALIAKAIGQDNLRGLFVDTGFMRHQERSEVEAILKSLGMNDEQVKASVYDASAEYFEALKGITEPEEKRKIIGRLFIDIQRKVSADLGLDPENWMLGQGTIYPDTIESGGTKNAATIKTHHNRVPEIEELIRQGKVIEPIKDLYKDEVREVGEKLGLPHELVWRHPFPGPGLAVRMLCSEGNDWAPDHEQLNQDINSFLAEKDEALHALTLPLKSVGVQGDFRTYRHPVLLVPQGPSPEPNWDQARRLAPSLTNRFSEVNRVLLALAGGTHTPQAHAATLTPDRVQLLQIADHLVTEWLRENELYQKVWQFPTVLLPLSFGDSAATESIVLRPIISEEAMTANFAELPPAKVQALAQRLLDHPKLNGRISAVLYDITNKPPGTIEWE